jgi:hypothetical protein
MTKVSLSALLVLLLAASAHAGKIKGHTHDYYGRSSEINKAAWAFLQGRRLDKDPQYQDYTIGR